MTPREATEVVNLLVANWDVPHWSRTRYRLFCVSLEPYPFAEAIDAVGLFIRRGIRGIRPTVSDVVDAIDRHLAERKRLEQARADRMQIAGPKDPAVGALLKRTIEALERRRDAADAQAPRQRSGDERRRGQAARRAGGTARR